MQDRFELFTGTATDLEARVYARFCGPTEGGPIAINGRLRGPFCQHARTLVADIAFRDLAAGSDPVAEAVVPDPCSWSPDLPHWYEVELEARQQGRVVQVDQAMFAIRRFGVHGNSFLLDGRRWVIRGAHEESPAVSALADWRQARMAMAVEEPNDALCEAASREGVMLLARISPSSANETCKRLLHLARWPAVAIVVLPNRSSIVSEPSLVPKNLIVARIGVPGDLAPLLPGERAILYALEEQQTLPDGRFADPVIVSRVVGRERTPIQARADCDALQAELAPVGDFAGYLT